jgi:RHS repeat-associated protein
VVNVGKRRFNVDSMARPRDEPLSTTPTATVTTAPNEFTGKERDSESGLDNFGARYNSTSLGRFMSSDPDNAGASLDAPQSWNAYSYVLNNPVNATDSGGLWCVWEDGTHDDDMRNGGASEGNCADQGGHWDPFDTITGIYWNLSDRWNSHADQYHLRPPCKSSECGAGTTLEGFDQTLKSYSQFPDDSPTLVGIKAFFTFAGGRGNKPTCAGQALESIGRDLISTEQAGVPAAETAMKAAAVKQAARAAKYAASQPNNQIA